jgi:threonine dehydratase
VLAGFEVPDYDRSRFQAFLDTLGYPYWEESENPVCGLFLMRAGA